VFAAIIFMLRISLNKTTLLDKKISVLFLYMISRNDFWILFQTICCHPEQISYAAALCSFKSYEPWTKMDIVPAGRRRKRIWLFSPRRLGDRPWKKMNMTFFLTKDIWLTVDENGYAPDKHNFISKQSFLLTNLATCFGISVKQSCD